MKLKVKNSETTQYYHLMVYPLQFIFHNHTSQQIVKVKDFECEISRVFKYFMSHITLEYLLIMALVNKL